MDDIIVIILTLIFIVASIFGQKKKRPPVPEATAEPQPADDNFWDMLEKQWDEIQQPVPAPAQKTTEQQATERSEPQHYTFHPESEGDRIVAQKPEKPKKTFLKTKKKKFPLREAVIYSEVLNRKYT